MRLLLVGHSFLSRLRQYMMDEGLPAHFNLDSIQDIHWFRRGGMRLDNVWVNQAPSAAFRSSFQSFKPTHVYIELGTNDLSHANYNEALCIARDLSDLVQWILHNSVKIVIWGKILYRLKDLRDIPRTARYDFGVDLILFEEYRQLVASSLHKTLPGLARIWSHSHIEARKNLICLDGVHLTNPGVKRYYYSLRGAFMCMSDQETTHQTSQ